jgi:hypothetical protein
MGVGNLEVYGCGGVESLGIQSFRKIHSVVTNISLCMMGAINKFSELLTIFYCENRPLHRAKGSQIFNGSASGGFSAFLRS